MNYQVLVNKQNGLEDGYIPSNLVPVDSKYKEEGLLKLEALAYQKWLELKASVLSKDYIIDVESAYRSYDYQLKILQELIEEKGKDYALRAVALPGFSEHQTGLAIDYCILKNKEFVIEEEFNDTFEECIYTNSIAHKYGFIVRYPKGKEDITGYKYEPWHLRYVGIALASYLHENKITLDEYYKEDKK